MVASWSAQLTAWWDAARRVQPQLEQLQPVVGVAVLLDGQPRVVQGQCLQVDVAGVGGQLQPTGVVPHGPLVQARVGPGPPGLNVQLGHRRLQRAGHLLGAWHVQQPARPRRRRGAELRVRAMGAARFAQPPGQVPDLLHVDRTDPRRQGCRRRDGQLAQQFTDRGPADRGDRAQCDQVTTQHFRAHPPRGLGDRDVSTVGGTEGQAHQLAGDAQAARDAHQHVVGAHPATGEDVGHLGLRLSGQFRDLPLSEPSGLEREVQGGDTAHGQHLAHVVTLVQGGVDGRPGARCRRASSSCCRDDVVGVAVSHRRTVTPTRIIPTSATLVWSPATRPRGTSASGVAPAHNSRTGQHGPP